MRVPTDRRVVDMLEDLNIQRFEVRKVWEMRQANRSAGTETSASTSPGAPGRAKSGTRASAGRHTPGGSASPRLRQGAVRPASLPSGPAPSFTGIALSLVILVAAAGVIGVGLAIYGVHRVMGKVSGI